MTLIEQIVQGTEPLADNAENRTGTNRKKKKKSTDEKDII